MAVNFYPPQNTTDKLMEEMLYQRSTQQKIMKIFAQSGYCEVQTPAFEYYDLFSPEYVTPVSYTHLRCKRGNRWIRNF